jgi:uncharacterized membrane protein YhaH (DUF805 family)
MQNTGILGLLASYTGRINRGKYWTAALIYIGVMIVMIAVGFIMVGNSLLETSGEDAEDVIAGLFSKGLGFLLLAIVVYIPMVVSGVFVGIKRLHDRDKSGWWLLLFYLVPALLSGHGAILSLIGFGLTIWGIVELGFLRGTMGPNRFGPDPLGAVAYQPSGA